MQECVLTDDFIEECRTAIQTQADKIKSLSGDDCLGENYKNRALKFLGYAMSLQRYREPASKVINLIYFADSLIMNNGFSKKRGHESYMLMCEFIDANGWDSFEATFKGNKYYKADVL